MAHVITEQCIKCKFTDCVAVCPVAAFREAEEYLIIDPVECIDCTLCVSECLADAIFSTADLPEEHACSVEFNATQSRHLPPILQSHPHRPDALAWVSIPNKRKLLTNLNV